MDAKHAKEAASLPMAWVWAGVLLILATVGGFLTPWDAILSLLENGGVGEEEASLIAFVGGFTFPLTLGVGVLILLAAFGVFDAMPGQWGLIVVAGVLFGSGSLASWLGLGLLPVFTADAPGGPPWVRLAWMAIQGYVNSYGWPLAICSAAIGAAAGLQVAYWVGKAHGEPDEPSP